MKTNKIAQALEELLQAFHAQDRLEIEDLLWYLGERVEQGEELPTPDTVVGVVTQVGESS